VAALAQGWLRVRQPEGVVLSARPLEGRHVCAAGFRQLIGARREDV